MSKERSELLELLNARKAWNLPAYVKPQFDTEKVRHAVRALAQAHDSDPFSGPRMNLYLAQGYELPSDVLAESNRAIVRRANAPRKGLNT